jgi:uncharacterized protein (DUF983 family)
MTMNQKKMAGEPTMMMEECMMMCPNCHEMKMGPMSMKSMMMKCDGCGKTMKEMRMM